MMMDELDIKGYDELVIELLRRMEKTAIHKLELGDIIKALRQLIKVGYPNTKE